MAKPSVKDIEWRLIYSKNGLEVFSDKEEPWLDFRVKLNNHWAKRFYGESAHSDVTRWVHDQAMEFWDFSLDDIYDYMVKSAIEELSRR